MRSHVVTLARLSLVGGWLWSVSSEGAAPRFNRDVRPILSDQCFRCHGPDAAARKAGLRLDDRVGATTTREGRAAIVPGRVAASELIRRITSTDPSERMPPPETGQELTAAEIATLRDWIAGGAAYEPHWAWLPPIRPSPPVGESDWPLNAIDQFVLARLEREQLRPSPPAARTTLIRRLALALTGLPPAPEEVAAFEREHGPDATPRLVDRLLRSPRAGERLALPWLDAARYADTHGYFGDRERSMWRWRDWVIDAFNRNLPYDQFTLEQLAGDLLPNATLANRIATGFNRNHMINNETGIIEEEFRVEYVADRLHTTATVWLGLTLECARCHDHKFDPISQRDYYRMFAFFNNVPEKGLDGSSGNAAPSIAVPTPEQERALSAARRQLADAERESQPLLAALAARQTAWERTAVPPPETPPTAGLTLHQTFDRTASEDASKGHPATAPGFLGKAAQLGGEPVLVDPGPVIAADQPFTCGAWIRPDSGGPACVLSKMDDANDLRGFDLLLRKGKASAHLIHRWNSDAIEITTLASIATRRWQHLLVTYDGSGRAAGLRLYLNGELQAVEVGHDSLRGDIHTEEPFRIGRRQASASYTGLIDEVRVHDRALSAGEVRELVTRQFLLGTLAVAAGQREPQLVKWLRGHFLAISATAGEQATIRGLENLRAHVAELQSARPQLMVMEELPRPRPAFVLRRGQYDQPGEAVTAGTPAALPAPPEGGAPNRLTLARWLTAPENPLAARVAVNRLWQQMFGAGLVATPEDFGSQGEPPSHPELLDWLATELVRRDWDLKALLRLMATSATFAQQSDATPAAIQRDPGNRLLARGPRLRLEAEALRDQALALGGLLVERIGGPSVKPPQPPGLWREVTYDGDLEYEADSGEGRYRRSLYTYWKRQLPPPALLTFDAPTREVCSVRRPRTNTPLQALALMNDPAQMEAARGLATRARRAAATSPPATREDDGLRVLFQIATARRPDSREAGLLRNLWQRQLEIFRANPAAAAQLVNAGPGGGRVADATIELAAWTTVASVMLSLDETLTRE